MVSSHNDCLFIYDQSVIEFGSRIRTDFSKNINGIQTFSPPPGKGLESHVITQPEISLIIDLHISP